MLNKMSVMVLIINYDSILPLRYHKIGQSYFNTYNIDVRKMNINRLCDKQHFSLHAIRQNTAFIFLIVKSLSLMFLKTQRVEILADITRETMEAMEATVLLSPASSCES